MSKVKTSVSVVVPCFNAEQYVADAVASALAQRHPIREVVCVDDGSTDGTLSLLRQLEVSSGGAVIVLSGPNRGPAAARNIGLASITGDYVQFLDADDLLNPEKVARQVSLIEAKAEAPAMVAGAYQRSFELYDGQREEHGVEVDADPWVGLVTGKLGITSANLYQTAAVRRAGGWDDSLRTSEDPDLAFRLLQDGGNVIHDPVPATTKRERRGSQWRADPPASLRGWLILRAQILSHMRGHGLMTPERAGPVEAAVFRMIRSMYTHDREFAEEAFAVMISGSFRPTHVDSGRVYAALYRAGGFRWAQRVYPHWLRAQRWLRPHR